jgi:hypothetical protein
VDVRGVVYSFLALEGGKRGRRSEGGKGDGHIGRKRRWRSILEYVRVTMILNIGVRINASEKFSENHNQRDGEACLFFYLLFNCLVQFGHCW